MMDWLTAAIDEIATEVYETSGPGTGLHVDEMRAIFDKHCPFKVDVAYMPVPRCDGCSWWQSPKPGHTRGVCRRLVDSSGLTHGSKAVATTGDPGFFYGILHTNEDFGCVQWEAK